MAATYVKLDSSKNLPAAQLTALKQFEAGWVQMQYLFRTWTTMLSGDGTQDAHYAGMAVEMGLVDGAAARAAYGELNTGLSAMSGAETALRQMFDRFRQN